ncbi:MAG: putative ribonucleoside-diphosphate reductase subunit beta [Prokaryotic dsDNA virus sp.]|jgi:ribonucleotide reductase beta subunit family protein with ferritin-like domain|nr:MAG: putative ribonucleoside-diphosphate reductase subunit beta [Prokaryotic dsDNA virus sp.]|tara:strand:+ start:64887 stop:65870 length:984 start_codon:yes stop_codon:yes gene_type:complete
MAVQIRTPKNEFTVDYPEAVEFADKQAQHFWPHDEVKVHKDKQDILVNMSESERHGVITTLKLFTLYEQIIGDEFWLNFVFKKFPRPADIQPMAALFGAMELQVHAKFYAKINEELGLANDEFYRSYLDDPELKARIDFLENTLHGKDDLRSLGAFTFGEGAILYSSFAFLKHFQSLGKNKLLNVVSGINFSARDENLHAEAAAWLFRTLKKEMKEAGELSEKEEESLKQDIIEAANTVLDHERVIIRKIFEKGKIDGITEIQLEHFAQSRINYCLENLGYEKLYKVEYNPIADYFYKGINGYQMQDFFSSQGNQYVRNWNKEGFRF